MFEMKDVNVMVITERAMVYQKIRVRFARNIVLYGLPESPDIIESSLYEILDNPKGWDMILKHRLNRLRQGVKNGGREDEDKMDDDTFAEECRKVVREGRNCNS